MRALLITIFLSLFVIMPAKATPQLLDTVNYSGETWVVREAPMNPYLLERKIKLSPANSGNRRGYVAHWKLDRDLVLTGVTWPGGDGDAFANTHLGGGQLPLTARWLTGTLVLGRDPKTGPNAHLPFTQFYERFVVIEFVQGRAVSHNFRAGEEVEAHDALREKYTGPDELKNRASLLGP